jgi:serine/threonine-protein kinase PknG
MSATACTQPGCTGAILDGYCDVCGSPGPAQGPSTSASSVGGVSGRCTQPGCSGTVVDGYCDICGSPGPEGSGSQGVPGGTGSTATGVSVATMPAGLAQSPSTVSRASNQLASTALGSARATADGSRVTRRVGTSSTRLRGARLGAGLTSIPPVPAVDAAKAVLKDPMVPEDRRTCPSCGSPVGRSRDGQPGRTEGFCPTCRNPFSFTPKLRAGDVVGGQYVVAGAIAHGGLGWIYAARDRNVSDRWVVLKGLLNSGDPDALAAAIAERQFLAQVEHPLIVEIYNFVTHEGAGYIVMEYVGGTSLKELLKQRMRTAGGVYNPLPADQAIAFIVEVLPAFQYLHDLNLVFCDFKPDNLIQVGDAVTLIDLGGVRRLDDLDSAIYGTTGYQAPEVPHVGPSVASDIYTIGRTLTVLAMEFRGYQSTYVASLPPVAETPLFLKYDSLYRLLLKACAPDPADRFVSADELRVQLLGVLREVVAADREGAAEHSTSSLLFDVPTVSDDSLDWQDLPRLRTDDSDPQMPWLRTVSIEDPVQRLAALEGAPAISAEVLLARARAALEAGQLDRVDDAVRALLADDPWEWRAVWMSGLVALARRQTAEAQSAFNAVYGQVPGELAPKLALAFACETGGDTDVAESLYVVCARCDANYIAPAAFGLARIRSGRGDVAGAVRALDLVPVTSRAFTQARRRRAGLLAGSGGGLPSLAAALDSIESLTIDPVDRSGFRVEVLSAALDLVQSNGADTTVLIAGRPAAEPSLRDGLEAAYRDLAGHASSREERVHLVDQANAVRRWTLR